MHASYNTIHAQIYVYIANSYVYARKKRNRNETVKCELPSHSEQILRPPFLSTRQKLSHMTIAF